MREKEGGWRKKEERSVKLSTRGSWATAKTGGERERFRRCRGEGETPETRGTTFGNFHLLPSEMKWNASSSFFFFFSPFLFVLPSSVHRFLFSTRAASFEGTTRRILRFAAQDRGQDLPSGKDSASYSTRFFYFCTLLISDSHCFRWYVHFVLPPHKYFLQRGYFVSSLVTVIFYIGILYTLTSIFCGFNFDLVIRFIRRIQKIGISALYLIFFPLGEKLEDWQAVILFPNC